MPRYAAFLRGMNLGKRRITNDELCAVVGRLGFAPAAAFLASGNVCFEADDRPTEELAQDLESGLEAELGYPVATFVRTAAEVRAIAERDRFADLPGPKGKPQVALLEREPDASSRATALESSTDEDRLLIEGRQLYWQPSGGLLDSELDPYALEASLGRMTIRTHNTLVRMAARFFPDRR